MANNMSWELNDTNHNFETTEGASTMTFDLQSSGDYDGGYGYDVTQPAFVYVAISVIGFLNNGFVILVMAKYKVMLKGVTNIYILNQSLIDGVISIFAFFSFIYDDEGYKPMAGLAGELKCRLWVTNYPVWSLMTSILPIS